MRRVTFFFPARYPAPDGQQPAPRWHPVALEHLEERRELPFRTPGHDPAPTSSSLAPGSGRLSSGAAAQHPVGRLAARQRQRLLPSPASAPEPTFFALALTSGSACVLLMFRYFLSGLGRGPRRPGLPRSRMLRPAVLAVSFVLAVYAIYLSRVWDPERQDQRPACRRW